MSSNGGRSMAGKATTNVVDLFSGAGGLSLGAARSGFAIRGAVEVGPEATSAHKLNFPHTVHLETDVSSLTDQRLRSALDLHKAAGHSGGKRRVLWGFPHTLSKKSIDALRLSLRSLER